MRLCILIEARRVLVTRKPKKYNVTCWNKLEKGLNSAAMRRAAAKQSRGFVESCVLETEWAAVSCAGSVAGVTWEENIAKVMGENIQDAANSVSDGNE